MTQDEIRAFLERFRSAWESHDVDTLVSCYADDCIVVSPLFRTLNGRSHVRRAFTDLFKAFSNQAVTIEDVVIDNHEPARAVMVWKLESTQIGEIFGIAPSGKRIERTVVFVLTLRDGLITKETRVYDFTSMLIELGVLRAKPAH
jgi:steroid delta-isomerase-like uncharacterized protein